MSEEISEVIVKAASKRSQKSISSASIVDRGIRRYIIEWQFFRFIQPRIHSSNIPAIPVGSTCCRILSASTLKLTTLSSPSPPYSPPPSTSPIVSIHFVTIGEVGVGFVVVLCLFSTYFSQFLRFLVLFLLLSLTLGSSLILAKMLAMFSKNFRDYWRYEEVETR